MSNCGRGCGGAARAICHEQHPSVDTGTLISKCPLLTEAGGRKPVKAAGMNLNGILYMWKFVVFTFYQN